MKKIPPIPELYQQISKNHLQEASVYTDELWYSRLVGRKISIVFTWIFLRMGLSPMQVTYLCIIAGVTGIVLMSASSMLWFVLGFVIFQLYIIWDSSDGEMARFLDQKSDLGAFIDKVLHVITKSGIYIPFGVQAARLSGIDSWIYLAFVVSYVSMLASFFYHMSPKNQKVSYSKQVQSKSVIHGYIRKVFRFITGDIELSYLLLFVMIFTEFGYSGFAWLLPLVLIAQLLMLAGYFVSEMKNLTIKSN